MKAALLCILLSSARGAELVRAGAGNNLTSEVTSVSRVLGLLKDLEAKLEKEGDAEKDLYDKFVCWGTSTVESKSKAITQAKARITTQEEYIADVESGVMTFTNEKARLEGELAALKATIQNMTAKREGEHQAFLSREQDNQRAVEALDEAERMLKKAADGKSPIASFLALRGSSEKAKGALGRKELAKKLKKVLKLGDEYLTKADAEVLRLVLSGQKSRNYATPEQYTSKSERIIERLEDIEGGIEKDLKADKIAEAESSTSFSKNVKTKQEQKTALEDSLNKLEEEFAARAQAMEEAKLEVANLKEQNVVDQQLIDTTNDALATKSTEWDARLAYRQGELQALGQAIQELSSDDARDLFHKAISFLQLSDSLSEDMLASRARSASFTLRATAKAAQDPRLLVLAAAVSKARHLKTEANPVFDAANDANVTNPSFDMVLDKIDDMKSAIRTEEEGDLKTKENCERNLTDNKADKISKERAIEEQDSEIKYTEGEIKELTSNIDMKAAEVVEVERQLEDAKKLRDAEAAEYAEAKKDDLDAVVLLEKAANFVKDFYARQAGSSFLQTRVTKTAQPLSDELQKAGAPSLWKDAQYGGAGAQSAGIVETLQTVADEVKQEIAVADKEESEAVTAYSKTKADLEQEKEDLEDGKEKLELRKGAFEDNKKDAGTKLKFLTGELKDLEKEMADLKPHCDFYLINFEVRQRNRNIELQGLDKAKAILKGAIFEDKSRELTVHDN